MLTATLGGLIKDYRFKKRLSQIEVSSRIGWNDTTRLSKIEQGRVGKPTRETVDKIIKALDLNEEEKGEFLQVGGYLPEDSEIEEMLFLLKPYIKSIPHSMVIIDFSWRTLFVNNQWLEMFTIPPNLKDFFLTQRPNLFEAAFIAEDQMDVIIQKGDSPEFLLPFAVIQMAKFKAEQIGREGDSWYVSMLKRLMQNDNFRELWPTVTPKSYHKEFMDYEYITITNKLNPDNVRTFHGIRTRIRSDQRFQMILYFPTVNK